MPPPRYEIIAGNLNLDGILVGSVAYSGASNKTLTLTRR